MARPRFSRYRRSRSNKESPSGDAGMSSPSSSSSLSHDGNHREQTTGGKDDDREDAQGETLSPVAKPSAAGKSNKRKNFTIQNQEDNQECEDTGTALPRKVAAKKASPVRSKRKRNPTMSSVDEQSHAINNQQDISISEAQQQETLDEDSPQRRARKPSRADEKERTDGGTPVKPSPRNKASPKQRKPKDADSKTPSMKSSAKKKRGEPKSALRQTSTKSGRKKRVSIATESSSTSPKKKARSRSSATQDATSVEKCDAGEAPAAHDSEEDALAMLAEDTSVSPNSKATQPLPQKKTSKEAKARLRKELDTLHQEMEVAHYSRKDRGNLRRSVPRSKLVAHHRQRRSLENQDDEFLQEQEGLYETSKRLRGSRAAQLESVVKQSLIFRAPEEEDDHQDEDDSDEDVDDEEGTGAEEGGAEAENVETDNAEMDITETEHAGTDHADTDFAETDHEIEDGKKKKLKTRGRAKRRSKSRKAARLRAFRSQKLAQREGEAIGLHIQGQNGLAVQKLKELAAEAPSAPQVYSALGTVYDSMLKDLQHGEEGQNEEAFEGYDAGMPADQDGINAHSIPSHIRKQIQLAMKAYGAFHIAAILFKKDFTLWVRAADLSVQIADLFSVVLSCNDAPDSSLEYARREKKRWLLEAKNDYQAADNLEPPGIDVGAKLATVYIELGNLAEALTLLTDMKGRKNIDSGRTAFDASYKVWLLYADLMLRIGFECKQWNHGDTSNSDYMFRRWLRKYSVTFDWQERRMQALAKALEAAAGTKACEALIKWIRERASEIGPSQEEEDKTSGVTENDTLGDRKGCEDEDAVFLAQENKDELENFDRTTADMKLDEGSKAARLRAVERSKLTSRLVPDISKAMDERIAALADPVSPGSKDHLPVSASVKTVCNIASDLMSLMMNCDLYEGCYHVGEAVSSYLRERGKLVESNLRRSEIDQDTESVVPENGAAYDILDAASEGEESVLVLSDDEDLEGADGAVIESLKMGILPPLIMSFYGLALLGIGKRRYAALKCIESITYLPQEDSSWFDDVSDSDRTSEMSYFMEHNAIAGGRTNLLALAARIVLKANDDYTTLGLLNLFETSDKILASYDVVPNYQIASSDPNPLYLHRLAYLVEISAALTFCLQCHMLRAPRFESGGARRLISSLKRTTKLTSSLWRLNEDGSLPRYVIMSLRSSVEAFRVLCGFAKHEIMQEISQDMLIWLSRFCMARSTEFAKFSPENSSILESSNLPLDVDWVTVIRSKISTRAHNLVVGTTVEAFSGWNEREFSSNAIGSVDRDTYVGLCVVDGRVAGFVRKAVRLELIKQWSAIHNLKPNFVVACRIADLLKEVEDASWFQREMDRLRNPDKDGNVATNGENEGLWMCILFSRISIALAGKSDLDHLFRGHILNALSVLLPLSQFILNERLWGSSIGILPAGTSFNSLFGPSNQQRLRKGSSKVKATGKKNKTRSAYIAFDSEISEVPFSNLIRLSYSKCMEIWNQGSSVTTQTTTETSHATMASLHQKIHLLRSCYAVEGVERAALEVAAALLAVAADPACKNIFVVLNQAASFASQGRRGGSSDRFFKCKLPQKDGTPLDYLLLLGRADCLNAIGFVAEASFLVSFVAKKCHTLRMDANTWNKRWELVAIYAYNVSVMTRANTTAIFEDTFVWKEEVANELVLGRVDGMRLFGFVRIDVSLRDEDESDDDDQYEEDEANDKKQTKRKRRSAIDEEEYAADEDENDHTSDPELSSDESEKPQEVLRERSAIDKFDEKSQPSRESVYETNYLENRALGVHSEENIGIVEAAQRTIPPLSPEAIEIFEL